MLQFSNLMYEIQYDKIIKPRIGLILENCWYKIMTKSNQEKDLNKLCVIIAFL